ncbi:MAG: hypothetical protein A2138_22105 [Deltaproteobacteria bacterium RBG_16_71_12]|nr:MAG: hypothetical protein A2138_22105 [Deltaproteobacteria bacterium RBG_16_71_12]
MLVVLVAALVIADAPAAAPQRTKLLVLDVQGAELEPAQRDTLTGTITARAARFSSLDVLSSQDLRQLADLRSDQAAAGCEDAASSCMAELANALGAELVLATRAGKLDAVTVITLQLFEVKKGAAAGRASVQGWSLPEVTDKVGLALDELLVRATGEQPNDQVVPSLPAGPRPDAGASAIGTGLLVGGAVALALGVVVGGLGATPALLYGGKKQELVELTADFDGSQDQLVQASRLHRDANDLRQLYNGVGRFGVIAGLLLVPLGGGALALSFAWPASSEAAP